MKISRVFGRRRQQQCTFDELWAEAGVYLKVGRRWSLRLVSGKELHHPVNGIRGTGG